MIKFRIEIINNYGLYNDRKMPKLKEIKSLISSLVIPWILALLLKFISTCLPIIIVVIITLCDVLYNQRKWSNWIINHNICTKDD